MNDPSAVLDALRVVLTPGVGPRTQQQLLEAFGSYRAILAATGDQLRTVPGIGPKTALAIRAAALGHEAEHELQRCQELGVQLILRDSEGYPHPLREIPDPPAVLYCRGTLQQRDELAIAIVGSRHCTVYGRQQAERLAGALARAGLTIVSGLARGIDAAAHRGALTSGGRTVAVLGTGLAEIYPPEHAALADEVVHSGAVVSEMPLDQAPIPGVFPQRNRIISGLSQGVIVVEASRKSGALHTARHAMEQGRTVFAVPGRIDSLASEGCHDLITDGAVLLRNIDDVLDRLGPLATPVQTAGNVTIKNPLELSLNGQETRILNLVTSDPLHVDEILREAELPVSQVLATLTALQMKRLVHKLPGNLYHRL